MTSGHHDLLSPKPSGPAGSPKTRFEELLPEAEQALAALRRARAAGTQPFLAYADARDDLAALKALAGDWRARYSRLVVLGTGGANLGGHALAATGPESERLLSLDNGDGDRLDRVLSGPDLDRTGFLVISKSGATAETLAQALLVLGGAEPVKRGRRHHPARREPLAPPRRTLRDHSPRSRPGAGRPVLGTLPGRPPARDVRRGRRRGRP